MTNDPKPSTSTDEAAEYVESIMASQNVYKVKTPVTRRKRTRSAQSSNSPEANKKARGSDASPMTLLEDDTSPRLVPTTRELLHVEPPTPAPRRKVCRRKLEDTMEVSLESLIERLSVDISERFSLLNDRIDRLEQGLEQRIANKVAQVIDKRINTEMKRLRKDVDAHKEKVADSIKADVAADIADINKKVSSVNPLASPDISCNIVVRNLQEHHNEDLQDKVSVLIREGCSVRDVEIVSAERKKGPQGKPGVVIVKVRSAEEKKKVLLNKRKLKQSRRYHDVYIQQDQTRTDRLIADNFRTMLTAIKSGNHNISLRGSRVVKSDSRPTDNSAYNNSEGESRRNKGRHTYNPSNSNRSNRQQNRR